MPRYKDHQEFYNIVAKKGRSEFQSFGAFPRDEKGKTAADDHKEDMEKKYPTLVFGINEE
jgi:hypothetical protein